MYDDIDGLIFVILFFLMFGSVLLLLVSPIFKGVDNGVKISKAQKKEANNNIYLCRAILIGSLFFFFGLFEENPIQSSIAILFVLLPAVALLYKGIYKIPKENPLDLPSAKMRIVAKYCAIYIAIAVFIALRNLFID